MYYYNLLQQRSELNDHCLPRWRAEQRFESNDFPNVSKGAMWRNVPQSDFPALNKQAKCGKYLGALSPSVANWQVWVVQRE